MILPARDSCEIKREGQRVLLIRNGEVLLDMPWEAALEVGAALRTAARQAEQNAKMEQVIQDQAILLRAGAPVQITYAGLGEAIKAAHYDPTLRKMPSNMSILNEVALGFPTIKVKK